MEGCRDVSHTHENIPKHNINLCNKVFSSNTEAAKMVEKSDGRRRYRRHKSKGRKREELLHKREQGERKRRETGFKRGGGTTWCERGREKWASRGRRGSSGSTASSLLPPQRRRGEERRRRGCLPPICRSPHRHSCTLSLSPVVKWSGCS